MIKEGDFRMIIDIAHRSDVGSVALFEARERKGDFSPSACPPKMPAI